MSKVCKKPYGRKLAKNNHTGKLNLQSMRSFNDSKYCSRACQIKQKNINNQINRAKQRQHEMAGNDALNRFIYGR